jgi:hypothetical protein
MATGAKVTRTSGDPTSASVWLGRTAGSPQMAGCREEIVHPGVAKGIPREDKPARPDAPDLEFAQHGLEIGHASEDRHLPDALPDMPGLRGEDADRLERVDRVAPQPRHELVGLFVRARDEHGHPVRVPERALLAPPAAVKPVGDPRPGQQRHLHEPVDHGHGPGDDDLPPGQEVDDHQERRRDRDREPDPVEVGDRDVFPG